MPGPADAEGVELVDAADLLRDVERLRGVREPRVGPGDVTTAFQPIWNLAQRLAARRRGADPPRRGLRALRPRRRRSTSPSRSAACRDLDALCVAQRAPAPRPSCPPGALLFLNIAPQTLDLDADGDDWLLRAARAADVAPGRVVIEVTERFGGRTAPVLKSLRRLREQGFKLALDDVGTGNAGLEMLSEVERRVRQARPQHRRRGARPRPTRAPS